MLATMLMLVCMAGQTPSPAPMHPRQSAVIPEAAREPKRKRGPINRAERRALRAMKRGG